MIHSRILSLLFCLVFVQTKALIHLIPVNDLEDRRKRSQLAISIPDDQFKPISLEYKDNLKEFILRSEQATDYTQKIAIQSKYLHHTQGLASFAELKALADAFGGFILEESEVHEESYTVVTRIVRRSSVNKHELIALHHYIGPEGFAGLQYTISLYAMTEQEALTTVKDFIRQRLRVVVS